MKKEIQMTLSKMKIFNTSPDVKPVVRINSSNKACVISSSCSIGADVANRYVDYHSFLNASAGAITLNTPDELFSVEYWSYLNGLGLLTDNKKPTC